MYECFHCGEKAVAWCADWSYEDVGIDWTDGIVHECECANCGAIITYYVDLEEANNED